MGLNKFPDIYTYRCNQESLKPLKEFVLSDSFGMPYKRNEDVISKQSWYYDTRDPDNDDCFRNLFYEHYWGGYCNFFRTMLDGKIPKLTNLWYQVYEKGDIHEWHLHKNVDVANVIYLQLEDKSLATQFKVSDTESYTPDVNEGDTILFDATYLHRSPVNNTDSTKMIISFNVNALNSLALQQNERLWS